MNRTEEEVIEAVLDGIDELLGDRVVTAEARKVGRAEARRTLLSKNIDWTTLANSELTNEQIRAGVIRTWKEHLS